MQRCAWARTPLDIEYHDCEWGLPLHEERALFEFLVLEGAQAGLSWNTILRKRAHYRHVFDNFEPARVARYGEAKVAALLADPGIVRNRSRLRRQSLMPNIISKCSRISVASMLTCGSSSTVVPLPMPGAMPAKCRRKLLFPIACLVTCSSVDSNSSAPQSVMP